MNSPHLKCLGAFVFTQFLLIVGNVLPQGGIVDAAFNPVLGTNGPGFAQVRAVTVQGDGKILVGGRFYGVNGVDINHLVRLHPDGTVDTNFNIGTGFTFSEDHPRIQERILVLSSGKILVSAFMDTFNGTEVPFLIRLNSNGSLDPTFDIGSGPGNSEAGYFGNVITQMEELGDGSILVSGAFIEWDGAADSYLVKLGPDGARDPSFQPGLSAIDEYGYPLPFGSVSDFVLREDGKILIAGDFQQVNGQPRFGMTLLHPNGMVDTNFNAGAGITGGEPHTHRMGLRDDGKILLSGLFSEFNNHPTPGGLVLLNADGSTDTSFAPVFAADPHSHGAFTWGLIPQPDNKWIVTGEFIGVNGQAHLNIVRLNADGSVDPTFNTQVTPGEAPAAFTIGGTLQADGNILLFGLYGEVSGEPRLHFARLLADQDLRIESIRRTTTGTMILRITKPTDAPVVVQATTDFNIWENLDCHEGPAGTFEVEDAGAALRDARYYRAMAVENK